jgi:agmatinase
VPYVSIPKRGRLCVRAPVRYDGWPDLPPDVGRHDTEGDITGMGGIATFLRSPYVVRPTLGDGDVAIIGVPYDEGTTGRAGAREGPRALREISGQWAYRRGTEPFWDGEAELSLLDGVGFVDTGDVYLPPTAQPEVTFPLIGTRVAEVLRSGLFPMVLGGDHSITYPLLLGVERVRGRRAPPVQLVQFDAHMDYWNDIGGEFFTHASPIIRVHEDQLAWPIVQYGIRSLHGAADNVDLARERGVVTHWCQPVKEQLCRSGVLRLLEAVEPEVDTWITFDIDCLDPAIAPGTGVPEPGGFSYYEARTLLRAIADRTNVIGMDLVEVSPRYDTGELAALHGVRLILDTVGAVFEKRRRPDFFF